MSTWESLTRLSQVEPERTRESQREPGRAKVSQSELEWAGMGRVTVTEWARDRARVRRHRSLSSPASKLVWGKCGLSLISLKDSQSKLSRQESGLNFPHVAMVPVGGGDRQFLTSGEFAVVEILHWDGRFWSLPVIARFQSSWLFLFSLSFYSPSMPSNIGNICTKLRPKVLECKSSSWSTQDPLFLMERTPPKKLLG